MDNFVIPHFSLHLFVDNRFENNCSSNLLLIISSLLEFKSWSLYGILALVKRCSSSIKDNFSKLKFGFNLFLSKFDETKLIPNFNFKKLSLMEEEHLLTKASIPYRDQYLNSSKDDIIKRRVDEQLFSNLISTKKWREKWGMTKLSVKS